MIKRIKVFAGTARVDDQHKEVAIHSLRFRIIGSLEEDYLVQIEGIIDKLHNIENGFIAKFVDEGAIDSQFLCQEGQLPRSFQKEELEAVQNVSDEDIKASLGQKTLYIFDRMPWNIKANYSFDSDATTIYFSRRIGLYLVDELMPL